MRISDWSSYVCSSDLPIARIDSISTKLVSAVGFSNGCALLALKKPPPLVPSSLIASWLATGPSAIVCLAPSSVVASTELLSVRGPPFALRQSPTTLQPARKQPSSTRVHPTPPLPI